MRAALLSCRCPDVLADCRAMCCALIVGWVGHSGRGGVKREMKQLR